MLIQIEDQVSLFEGPVTVGVIESDQGKILIDTGLDNSLVNKILKRLDEIPIAALITHHHADHMGGISKLNSLGVNHVYAPSREIPLFTDPFLEPLIFCGFHPPKHLTNRHLMAKPAKVVQPMSNLAFPQIKPMPTPGHSIDHHAFQMQKILFCGDAVFNEETIEKHRLLFASNPIQARESVEKISKLNLEYLVLGHGGYISGRNEIQDTLRLNIEHYNSAEQKILGSISEQGSEIHEIVANAFDNLNLERRNITQYILYRHAILGHISGLIAQGKVKIESTRLFPL